MPTDRPRQAVFHGRLGLVALYSADRLAVRSVRGRVVSDPWSEFAELHRRRVQKQLSDQLEATATAHEPEFDEKAAAPGNYPEEFEYDCDPED